MRLVALAEVAVCLIIVVTDFTVPSLAILVVAGASLALRRERPAVLGFVRPSGVPALLGRVGAIVIGWNLAQLALFMPLLEHLTGQQQDVSQFAAIEGDAAALMVLLALSWTLAALGEETAFRGFMHTRLVQALGANWLALSVTVLVTSAAFGVIHSEQGMVGMGLTFLDALLFSWLRIKYDTLWAPVFAHGLSNTIGLVAFFLVGPIHALW